MLGFVQTDAFGVEVELLERVLEIFEGVDGAIAVLSRESRREELG